MDFILYLYQSTYSVHHATGLAGTARAGDGKVIVSGIQVRLWNFCPKKVKITKYHHFQF